MWQKSVRAFVCSLVQAGLTVIRLLHPLLHLVFKIGRRIDGGLGTEIFLCRVRRCFALSAGLLVEGLVGLWTAFLLGQSLTDGKRDFVAFFINGKHLYLYHIANLYMVIDILNEAVGYLRDMHQALRVAERNNSAKGLDTNNLTFYDAPTSNFSDIPVYTPVQMMNCLTCFAAENTAYSGYYIIDKKGIQIKFGYKFGGFYEEKR